MTQSTIFLNGAYPAEQDDFYRTAIDKALSKGGIIAVDGALGLFYKLQKRPGCVLGDFDSVEPEALAAFPDLPRVEYPRDKEATDGELAIRYALEHGANQIEVFGAIDLRFETDQMLANILCLEIVAEEIRLTGRSIKARLVDHRQRIYLVDDSTLKLKGKPGDLLSIIPLTRTTTITVTGAKWELQEQKIRLGSSWATRNCFAGDLATVTIAGVAVVVHGYAEHRQ
jgi:thiamine pyrophosphokinase